MAGRWDCLNLYLPTQDTAFLVPAICPKMSVMWKPISWPQLLADLASAVFMKALWTESHSRNLWRHTDGWWCCSSRCKDKVIGSSKEVLCIIELTPFISFWFGHLWILPMSPSLSWERLWTTFFPYLTLLLSPSLLWFSSIPFATPEGSYSSCEFFG